MCGIGVVLLLNVNELQPHRRRRRPPTRGLVASGVAHAEAPRSEDTHPPSRSRARGVAISASGEVPTDRGCVSATRFRRQPPRRGVSSQWSDPEFPTAVASGRQGRWKWTVSGDAPLIAPLSGVGLLTFVRTLLFSRLPQPSGLRRGVRARAPLTRRLARLVDGPPLRRGGPGLPCVQDCWPWDLGIPAPATGNFRSQ